MIWSQLNTDIYKRHKTYSFDEHYQKLSVMTSQHTLSRQDDCYA